MKICATNHDTVFLRTENCPACAALAEVEELKKKIEQLDEAHLSFRMHVSDTMTKIREIVGPEHRHVAGGYNDVV